jgi:hypothetical protein
MTSSIAETLVSICLGIGLSAACGFRVFVPLLVLSIASISGHLELAHGFEWIGTYPALWTFAIATIVEIAGYYIPWVDHALDTIATPAAVVAGTLVTASVVGDVSPLMRWSLALIAGGGVAGMVQGTTLLTRGLSLAGTGGLANPFVATVELGGAVATSLLSLVAPLLVSLAILFLLLLLGFRLLRRPRTAQPT